MLRWWLQRFAVMFVLSASAPALAGVYNPDQITVFVPAFDGPGMLGRNVSTVLLLQIAQTSRRLPWPDNPEGHDFGEAMMRWSIKPLEAPDHFAATDMGKRDNLLAQIVVWGKAYRYGGGIVVEPNVTLPRYLEYPAHVLGTDYREKRFEQWTVDLGKTEVSVDVPRRQFSTSAIILTDDIVERFSEAAGLPMHSAREGGERVGQTGSAIRFLEFNKKLPGAPAKVKSGGVTGYVRLPELSATRTEFVDMVAGILQVFRGDWDEAVRSFTRVLENSQTRTPLRVDALLYRGMVKTRGGGDGRADFEQAASLAPYDETVVRYRVMGELAAASKDPEFINKLLIENDYLFATDDPWVHQVATWAQFASEP